MAVYSRAILSPILSWDVSTPAGSPAPSMSAAPLHQPKSAELPQLSPRSIIESTQISALQSIATAALSGNASVFCADVVAAQLTGFDLITGSGKINPTKLNQSNLITPPNIVGGSVFSGFDFSASVSIASPLLLSASKINQFDTLQASALSAPIISSATPISVNDIFASELMELPLLIVAGSAQSLGLSQPQSTQSVLINYGAIQSAKNLYQSQFISLDVASSSAAIYPKNTNQKNTLQYCDIAGKSSIYTKDLLSNQSLTGGVFGEIPGSYFLKIKPVWRTLQVAEIEKNMRINCVLNSINIEPIYTTIKFRS